MADNDEWKGKVDNLKGRAKQAAGAVTGDKELEAEGLAERVKGAAQEKIGEAKKALRKTQEDDEDDEP